MLAELDGLVLELGAGVGDGFADYPATVTQVLAVDIDADTIDAARATAAASLVPVTVVQGFPDALPIDNALCDAGVVSLALCCVPHPVHALLELYRVIRPGGELRYREHVRAEGSTMGRLQDAMDRPWARLTGGCHLNRVTGEAIRAAGFDVLWERRIPGRIRGGAVAPVLLGAARRP